MTAEVASHTKQVFLVAEGSIGPVERDRGGNWYEPLGVWVHPEIQSYMDSMPEAERLLVERSFPLSFAVATAYNAQIADVDSHQLWPQSFYENDGTQKLLEAAEVNPSIGDPFAVVRGQPPYGVIPFSLTYFDELQSAVAALEDMIATDSPSAVNLAPYLDALRRAYTPDELRTSDLPYLHEADTAWVHLDPDTELIFFAEPTESYSDNLAALRDDDSIRRWAIDVANANGLGPWKNFFEFRLMQKVDFVVNQEEVDAIRATTRNHFVRPGDAPVPASLEFRRLLLASGHGAHPARTAKNYPNFNDIRNDPNGGYKNVLYTNMIEEGLDSQAVPILMHAFGTDFMSRFPKERLMRGSTLRIIGHEENHSYRVHKGNLALEELKATIDGFVAVDEAGRFKDEIDTVCLSTVGGALFIRYKTAKARAEGDTRTERGYKAYHTGDTIMMNYLAAAGAFIDVNGHYGDIDFDNFRTAMRDLCKELEQVREGTVSASDFQAAWGAEEIWDSFKVLPPGVELH
ncbi:hypothetical protein A3B46_03250 [Candidatus Roizmanbacteria bacterium RIFCSPLOWO2_01_FULL_39_19]|nr:MAG: hypothetical protein A3B46_03250 [Candidatus Roizmanbacteria bacterium RIFCSPLOWO2_01_FULL_39_19]